MYFSCFFSSHPCSPAHLSQLCNLHLDITTRHRHCASTSTSPDKIISHGIQHAQVPSRHPRLVGHGHQRRHDPVLQRHLRQLPQPSQWLGSTSNGFGRLRTRDFPANEEFASHCYCWAAKDDIHAVDRVWISTAIDRACETYFTGGVGKPFLRLVAQLCTSADTFAGDPVSVYGTAPGLTPCQAHHP